ncbi:MAG TPA: ABC transporter ATP-binding protein [Acidobacteriota bacterium]|nr:ABC transporter ATP-binding protein [Acidobacteriota bacterium]
MSKPQLRAESLSKRYAPEAPLALDRLTLSVQDHEIYCLLGANGAGKTTCINLFLGFLRPTSGKALLAGIDVHADPLEAKKHVAYVPENVMLYGGFDAVQNLRYFAQLARQPLDRQQCRSILRKVGIQDEALRRNVHSFSKGMRQKLGIAVALVKQAPVILLDEPTSGLDPKAAMEFLEILRRLREEGKAILMSTHDIFRVKAVASRVGIMKDGRLLSELDGSELETVDLQEIYLDYMGQGRAAIS